MMTRLHMKIHTSSRDQDSVLVMHDGYLVAIFVRLDDPIHEAAIGKWHLEAHFDHVPSTGRLFDSVDEAEAWVAGQTDTPDPRPGFAPPAQIRADE